MAENTGTILKLLIISKYPYNSQSPYPGWCYLGLDRSQGKIYRPVPELGPDERDYFWPNHQNFKVGETHEFHKKIDTQDDSDINPGQIEEGFSTLADLGWGLELDTLPHLNNDVKVTHRRRTKGDVVVDMLRIFDMLYKEASDTIEEALGLGIGELLFSNNGRPYVEEGKDCQSFGIYKCAGQEALDLFFHDDEKHEAPANPNQEVLVIIETARPLFGKMEFTPKRCFLIEAGLIYRQ